MPKFLKVNTSNGELYGDEMDISISDIMKTIANEASINSRCRIQIKSDKTLSEFLNTVKECQEVANEINSSQIEYHLLISAQIWDNMIHIIKLKSGETAKVTYSLPVS